MHTCIATSAAKRLLLLIVIASAVIARSEAKRIRRDELPAAVRKTADQQAEGATVRGHSKELEQGQVEFEIDLLIDGHTKDVSIAPDGRVLEIQGGLM